MEIEIGQEEVDLIKEVEVEAVDIEDLVEVILIRVQELEIMET